MSAGHVPVGERTVVAIGGHDFTAAPGNSEIGDYVLGLVPAEAPSVCLLPTASGDPVEQIARFRQFFGLRGASVSHVSLFRLEDSGIDVADHLLAQDVIYVGGGSLINLMAILGAHGIDEVLGEAWRRGIVVCGQSAGAMCWFQEGITRSTGAAGPAPGMGILHGMLSVHYHRDPDRRSALLDAVAADLLPGWGIDDQAALRFAGREPVEAVAGREGAGVWRVEAATGGNGVRPEPEEVALPVRRVEPDPPVTGVEDGAIAELRATRAMRDGRALPRA